MSKGASCSVWTPLILITSPATGEVKLVRARCKRSLRCAACARLRAQRLVRAITAIARERGLKAVFVTATLPPSRSVSAGAAGRARAAMLRRARQAGASGVYVCVIEAHKSGAAHFHLVVAEASVRMARLSYRHGVYGGHTLAKRVSRVRDAIAYVSKYVSKHRQRIVAARVVSRRAAQRGEARWRVEARQRRGETDEAFAARIGWVDPGSD